MVTRAKRQKRQERRRAGSSQRDAQHQGGGDWSTLTIPEGMDVWQAKAGSHRIDIVPYEVGKGNPYAPTPGEWYYERTFFIHRNIGPDNSSYVCPAKTAGKPCPVCEHRAALARDPDADESLMDALKPRERQLWLIYDHAQEDKGVQLFETSHWTFGALIDKCRRDAEEDEDYVADFDDPAAGSTLKVSFAEEKGGGYTFLKLYNVDFKPRRDGLSEELLDHGHCLDDLLKIPTYDRLKAIFDQVEESEDEDEGDDPVEEPERKGKKNMNTATDSGLEVGQMVGHDKLGECEIVRISGDGTSLTLEDDGGDSHKGIGVDEVFSLVDDEPEDKPKPSKRKPKPDPEPDEDEDDDMDEGDEPEPPKRKAKKKAPAKKKSKPKPEPEPDEDDEEWDEDDDDDD